MNKKGRPTVYCLKVTLKGIRPVIWRRFKVNSDITLNKLHQVLQRVMGWTGAHLHNFKSNDNVYSLPDPEWEADLRFQNENRIRLGDVCRILSRLRGGQAQLPARGLRRCRRLRRPAAHSEDAEPSTTSGNAGVA